jgi:hypothetical protein
MAKYHGSGNNYNETAIVNELYMMALARKPSSSITVTLPRRDPKTGKEMIDPKTGKPMPGNTTNEAAFLGTQIAEMKKHARNPADYKAFFEDVFWSLLNTNEFILNH